MFAVHRPGVWEVAGVEIWGAMYPPVVIADGTIMRIVDHSERGEALAVFGLNDT